MPAMPDVEGVDIIHRITTGQYPAYIRDHPFNPVRGRMIRSFDLKCDKYNVKKVGPNLKLYKKEDGLEEINRAVLLESEVDGVIEMHHMTEARTHRSKAGTVAAINGTFWCPGLIKLVNAWWKNCGHCSKASKEATAAKDAEIVRRSSEVSGILTGRQGGRVTRSVTRSDDQSARRHEDDSMTRAISNPHVASDRWENHGWSLRTDSTSTEPAPAEEGALQLAIAQEEARRARVHVSPASVGRVCAMLHAQASIRHGPPPVLSPNVPRSLKQQFQRPCYNCKVKGSAASPGSSAASASRNWREDGMFSWGVGDKSSPLAMQPATKAGQRYWMHEYGPHLASYSGETFFLHILDEYSRVVFGTPEADNSLAAYAHCAVRHGAHAPTDGYEIMLPGYFELHMVSEVNNLVRMQMGQRPSILLPIFRRAPADRLEWRPSACFEESSTRTIAAAQVDIPETEAVQHERAWPFYMDKIVGVMNDDWVSRKGDRPFDKTYELSEGDMQKISVAIQEANRRVLRQPRRHVINMLEGDETTTDEEATE